MQDTTTKEAPLAKGKPCAVRFPLDVDGAVRGIAGARGGERGELSEVITELVRLGLAARRGNVAAVTPSRAPSDPDRLRAAMAATGLTSRGVRDAAGLGHHTTVDQVLREKLTLAKAGGGALLAWVKSVEAGHGER